MPIVIQVDSEGMMDLCMIYCMSYVGQFSAKQIPSRDISVTLHYTTLRYFVSNYAPATFFKFNTQSLKEFQFE